MGTVVQLKQYIYSIHTRAQVCLQTEYYIEFNWLCRSPLQWLYGAVNKCKYMYLCVLIRNILTILSTQHTHTIFAYI